ncbi:MAG: hypothetical protein ACI810_001151 [Gammaproteobacteria bacterium]|jgi:hypothetical protein
MLVSVWSLYITGSSFQIGSSLKPYSFIHSSSNEISMGQLSALFEAPSQSDDTQSDDIWLSCIFTLLLQATKCSKSTFRANINY